MTFAKACLVVLPTGQYRGKPIGNVGVTEEGLLYLDTRRGHAESAEELAALEVYLAQDQIRDDLERLAAERG
jgi:hypothetical protein